MKMELDCIPCFIRQALESARLVSSDPKIHEQILRETLTWACDVDLELPAPLIGQRIHRRIRELTGVNDPYSTEKKIFNRMAYDLLPQLRETINISEDPLLSAVRIAIAGNVIDMGVAGDVSEPILRRSILETVTQPVRGDMDAFRSALDRASSILYLADNAGEIVLDRLLIERMASKSVTVVVRGQPVINDATLQDARDAGLFGLVSVIDNGSDAPGTVLSDCSAEFLAKFNQADLIIAKGQGNFETLSDVSAPLFFLFKVKCPVIATHINQPIGSFIVADSISLNH